MATVRPQKKDRSFELWEEHGNSDACGGLNSSSDGLLDSWFVSSSSAQDGDGDGDGL